jgi:hypothetical protein
MPANDGRIKPDIEKYNPLDRTADTIQYNVLITASMLVIARANAGMMLQFCLALSSGLNSKRYFNNSFTASSIC